SALRGAVAAAASSGIRAFEAAAVVTETLVSEADLAVLREFGVGVPVLVAGSDGVLRDTLTT
ncbi:MAG: cytidine deaminase, partial [Actinobacteria bacterium]|nr:cytidine deaminase [Actinomycetota bacterium]MCA1721948.1 cytidine deaminase [Actinomycetota bacterium]